MRDGGGSEWLQQTAVDVVGTQASSPTPSVSQLGLWFQLSDTRTSTEEVLEICCAI